MRILGVDPGYAILGWGVLDLKGNHFSVVDYGAITTDAKMEMMTEIFENTTDFGWLGFNRVFESNLRLTRME